MSSSVALPFCVRPAVCECLLLHTLASTGATSVLHFANFNGGVVASHCFDLHLPDDLCFLFCLFVCLFFSPDDL